MPTKTTTITHEPWCAEHDDDSAGAQRTVLGAFRVCSQDAEHTHYEADDDLRLKLSKGGATPSVETPAGGAVLVLLDVDGCGYGVVKVDTHHADRDLQAVEQALAHLTTVRDELRRLA